MRHCIQINIKEMNLKDVTNPTYGRGMEADNIKTEMCKNWIELGSCSYGIKCRFAHGKKELVKRVNVHHKYKSKPCLNFHTQMFCPYGNRCLFQHDERTIKDVSRSYYVILLKYPELGERIGKRPPRLPIFIELTGMVNKDTQRFTVTSNMINY